MTTREKVERLLDRLSERELEAEYERLRHAVGDQPEMIGLPEAWRTFEDGTPVPNWVAGLDEVRNGA